MGKTINVTSFSEMGKAAKKLQEHSVNYDEYSKALLEKAGNMGAAWQGEDNLAFVARINGFAEELKLMADKIHAAGEALDAQRANYQLRQDDNIVQVNKLVN